MSCHLCVYEMMWLIFCKVHRSEVNNILYIHPEDQDYTFAQDCGKPAKPTHSSRLISVSVMVSPMVDSHALIEGGSEEADSDSRRFKTE